MKVEVTELANKKPAVADVTLTDAIFAVPYNEGLIHQVIVAYMAAARAGTKQNKGRSDVRGGGVKPRRQKGTGCSRAGTITSPIWRTGGVTFAARPRDYTKKVNRKMYRGAMRSIISEHFRQKSVNVVEDIPLKDHKTKTMLALMKSVSSEKILILVDSIQENMFLSCRNIGNIELMDVDYVNPLSLFKAKNILLTVPAVQKLQERLS